MLLDSAQQAGYDVLITTDQNIRYQQDLTNRRIAIMVLLSTSWPRIRAQLNDIADALDRIRPGDYVEIAIHRL